MFFNIYFVPLCGNKEMLQFLIFVDIVHGCYILLMVICLIEFKP